MKTTALDRNAESTSRMPLRLWPGVVLAVIVVVARLLVPLIVPEGDIYGMATALAGTALILLWWVFFSRAPWIERIGVLVVTVASYFAIRRFLHESISGGLMGRMFIVYAIPPVLGPALVAWAAATRNLSDGIRRVTMVITIVLSCAVWTLIRTDGVSSDAIARLHWRWTPTAEDRLIARGEPAQVPAAAPAVTPSAPVPASAPETKAPEKPVTSAPPSEDTRERSSKPVEAKPARDAAIPAAEKPAASEPIIRHADWPGFRGLRRDNVIHGVQIATDWSASPPTEVWRRPIGPGWSSFAVDRDRIYTQEQRGEEEIVSCYRLSTGEPLWRHSDAVRFYESNGGPGPRATPTLHNGRVYTLGATAILNALDAATGKVVWSRNAASDTGAAMPGWGFTGSPLVYENLVIVATSGRLAAYEIATGKPRWTRITGGSGYSSPHLLTLAGIPQIVLLHGAGATSVAPLDGTEQWKHEWNYGTAIVQPAVAANGELLIALGDAMGGSGIRRVAVTRQGSEWKLEERWTTRGLKPYFNDFVVHEGHAYGFDGSILSCVDLADGNRKWKGGRYGQGQMLLLPDQDLLLVLSEEGDLALVSATPDKHTEIAKFKAIEGKTWNHPVLLGNLLLVRNGEEMAVFRLARTDS